MADLYQLLATSSGASAQQLRSAYRTQLRRHHPDRFRAGSAEHRQALAVTRALVAAWEVLGDPASRAAYDLSLGTVAAPAPTPEPARAAIAREEDPAAALRRRRVEQRYADVLGHPSTPAAAQPAAATTGSSLRMVLVALAWVAGVVWAVHVAHLLGSPQPAPGAWLTALGLGAVLVGPWWLLSRAVPTAQPAR